MKYPTTPHLVPNGGWRYTDPDTGIAFKSSHIDALVQKVRKSRIANGLLVGAEWVEILYNGMCEQNPGLKCSEVGKQEVTWNADDLSSFLTTLMEMRNSGTTQVNQEEYDRRVAICMRCPKRGHVRCNSCGAFGALLQRVVAGIRITDTNAYSMSCMACGCSIVSKAAYPQDVLKAVDTKLSREPEYWSDCWMRE
jgi:hypothetical protein